ncbi:hypothetical protein [Henriciella litoralis]|uniref:hypothetical protein n=1 Tax=Henriciella litoralis TaxID=568102 RepID=UPI00111C714C|nr:hypothetical protein [Henriciella litoralis]
MKSFFARIPHSIRVIGFFVIFSVGAWWLSTFTNPTAHADRNQCLKREGNTGPYTNGCDYDINARYCFRNDGQEKTCGVVALKPGEKMSDLREEFDAASAKHLVLRTTVHACKAPFIPDDVASQQSTIRKVDGCRKPDKSGGAQ